MRHYTEDEQVISLLAGPQDWVVLGIDPGPTESAWALVRSDYSIAVADKGDNGKLLDIVLPLLTQGTARPMSVVIEGVLLYQKSANHIRETAYAIGWIQRECHQRGLPYTMIDRPTYVSALCGGKGNDALLRAALEIRFGGYSKGEPLALLRGNTDKRSAYGVAVYWLDRQKLDRRRG